MRSALVKLLRNAHSPAWWRETAIPHVQMGALRRYSALRGRGCAVMDEDWDNLIVLDACRYDLYEQLNTIDGRLEHRISKGSTSQEFFERNFGGEQCYDTVYVSANPFVKLLGVEDAFYDVVHVWDDGWDESLMTVPPERMVEATVEAFDEHPNKRVVAHFMQPHHPFVGEFGREALPGQTGFTNTRDRARERTEETISEPRVVWHLLDDGEVDAETVWKAYRENLAVVLPHVRELVEYVGQKTVVTADHGNLIDERVGLFPSRISGHPRGVHVDELVKVPWLVTEREPRKEVVTAEQPLSRSETSGDATRRLRHLGYA